MRGSSAIRVVCPAITVVMLALCVSAGDVAYACTDFESFFKELGELRKELKKPDSDSWARVYSFILKHAPGCDDGIYGEAFSDIVTRVLAKKWKDIDKLLRIIESDKDFYRFTLKHVDATTDYENLKMIVKNARNRCPKKAEKICSELESRADAAIRDIEALPPIGRKN